MKDAMTGTGNVVTKANMVTEFQQAA